MSRGRIEGFIKGILDGLEAVYSEVKPARLKVTVKPEDMAEAARRLLSSGFDHLHSVVATDFPRDHRIEVSYIVGSVEGKLADDVVFLTTSVPRDSPELDTLSGIWPAAGLHEREQWEMLGVVFRGNDDLRPLFLEDWRDIPPLRKDYVLKRWVDEERERHGLKVERA